MARLDKQAIYELLDGRGIWHVVTEHPAVYNMAEAAALTLPHPEAEAKNLFVRDDRHRAYYLLCVNGEKRVDLREVQRGQGTRRLSFASADDLERMLGLVPGAVTPLGLLNDDEHRVELFLDEDFLAEPGLIGIHPNDNTATVLMRTADLVGLVEEHGSVVRVVRV